MNNAEENNQIVLVSNADKTFQVLGRSKACRCCDEACLLISDTRVVGMLHDCHNLDCVIALTSDSSNHVISKVLVAANLVLLRRNADMTLVNSQRSRLHWLAELEFIFRRLWWIPNFLIVIITEGKICRW